MFIKFYSDFESLYIIDIVLIYYVHLKFQNLLF